MVYGKNGFTTHNQGWDWLWLCSREMSLLWLKSLGFRQSLETHYRRRSRGRWLVNIPKRFFDYKLCVGNLLKLLKVSNARYSIVWNKNCAAIWSWSNVPTVSSAIEVLLKQGFCTINRSINWIFERITKIYSTQYHMQCGIVWALWDY